MYPKAFSKFSWKEAFFSTGGLVFLFSCFITFIGITFIHSASYSMKLNSYLPYSQKQIQWACIALGVLVVVMHIDYRILVKYAVWIYALGIILLILTAATGTVRNGSRRWLKLGPMLFQTSDFMKLAIIFILAKVLSRQNKMKKITDLILPFFITAIPVALILKQPDMGTSLVFIPILFAMVFVSGAQIRHLVLIILVAVNIAPIAYFYGLKDYQQKRVKMFLFQESMTTEQRRAEGYHLTQSMIAHGSGGLFGKGLEKGTQQRNGFLPERHTDFIFAVVGEEWGFIGTTFVLFMYFLFFLSMLFAAHTSIEPAGQLIIVGITALFLMQTFVNTCMTIGMAPITGLPLPFMSYGGTSLLFSTISMAMVLSIKGHTHRRK